MNVWCNGNADLRRKKTRQRELVIEKERNIDEERERRQRE